MEEYKSRFFGKRLKECRKVRGLSQKQFGDLTNLSHSDISLKEAGKRLIQPEEVEIFAKVLGINPAYLTDENVKYPTNMARALDQMKKEHALNIARYQYFSNIGITISEAGVIESEETTKDIGPEGVEEESSVFRTIYNVIFEGKTMQLTDLQLEYLTEEIDKHIKLKFECAYDFFADFNKKQIDKKQMISVHEYR